MMETFRISVLSVILCMAHITCVIIGEGLPPKYGKVGGTVNLECPSGDTNIGDYRAWYRGNFNGVNPPLEGKKLVRGKDGNFPKTKLFRPDMKLDETKFTLTLTVQDDASDNDLFTCVTEQEPKVYDVTQVFIFLQPEVSIAADPKQPEAGLNITITCTIDRLYPNITSDQFTMRWGNADASDPEFSAAINADGFMKYTLKKTKTLTQDDNGLNVKCTVTPEPNFGEPASGNITLAFSKTPPTDPAPITDGKSSTAAIVGGVIGGLAVVGLVALIMVIVLGRKKPNKDTRQSGVKGSRIKTNKPPTEGVTYADLDLATLPGRSMGGQGFQPPTAHRPVQEPTEYALIDFDKLKRKMSRDKDDLDLSDVEDPKKTTG